MGKNFWIGAAVLASLGAALCAQTAVSAPDARTVRQELDTMKGILRTSLRYATDTEDRNAGIVFEQEIEAYYLSGQGAVFIVPVHLNGVPGAPLEAMEAYLQAVEGQQMLSERVLRDLEREVERATRDAARALENAKFGLIWEQSELAPEAPGPPPPPEPSPAPEVAPAPEVPGAPPPPPPSDARRMGLRSQLREKAAENAKERLQELRTRVGRQKEENEQRRKEMETQFSQVRESLVEALSKFGDSLSIVRPQESVTLILKRDAGWFHLRRPLLVGDSSEEGDATVISVKKSDVADFKAGRISRVQFLDRVVEYRQ